ncbi:MAG: response regulator [Candidatus Hodarchaeales archaeon]|jgi:CheY-like chemotaxis protein
MTSEKKNWDLSVITSTAFNADDSTKINVLCVDDDSAALEIAKFRLEEENSRLVIKTTTSAADALHKLASEAFDAVVCDYKMPGMDGLEFLEQLRSTGNMIPFIILTGYSREKIATQAMNLGVNHLINKSPDLNSQFSILAWAIIIEVAANRTGVCA